MQVMQAVSSLKRALMTPQILTSRRVLGGVEAGTPAALLPAQVVLRAVPGVALPAPQEVDTLQRTPKLQKETKALRGSVSNCFQTLAD